MSDQFRPAADSAPGQLEVPAGYEAPRIESSMTADDLEREALYAGNGITPINGPF